MKTVSMSGSLRENVGKKDAKAHRNKGLIPCVLYGGKEQLHFVANENDFRQIIFTPEICFVELNISGKTYLATLQDVQYHPVSDSILHVDFLEIIEDKKIVINIPIKIVGTSPGVLRGGKFVKKMRTLKVKGLAKYLPDTITIDISKLDIGDTIKVNNLEYENIEFLDVPTSVIVTVKTARGVEEASANTESK